MSKKEARKLPNDFAINAMVVETERRKKTKEAGRYSYGQLVADTTPEERERIAERYRKKAARDQTSAGHYIEPDDEKDARKASRHNPVGG